ncbi:MAG: hypothetical protein WC519_00705 [Parcubacteria group bacterium]
MRRIESSIFRAYDIRGIYPSEINEKTVYSIANFLSRRVFSKGKLIVAMDVRKSSKSLLKAIKRALGEREVIDVRYATTPMFYYLANKFKASGGIMVTASHNNPEWNGLKIVGKNAEAMGGYEILEKMRKENEG